MLPVLASVGLSFFDYDMLSAPKWAGLGNYLRMIVGDEVFPKTVINTLKFAIVTGPVSFFLSFLLAWFINEFKSGLRHILAFLFYAPSLAGNAYFVWQVAFSGDSYGYVNSFLLNFGLISEPINWFSNTTYNMAILIVIQLWLGMGVAFLANLAGLQNVNPEIYEAGALDGIRTRWHELWYITLPQMKPMLLFGAVTQIAAAYAVGPVSQALCGFPSVDYSAHTILLHALDYGSTRYQMGYAGAVCVVLFLLVLITYKLADFALSRVGR
mgnify:CR=1 FL=1